MSTQQPPYFAWKDGPPMAPPKSTRTARVAKRSIQQLAPDRRARRRRQASRAISILAATGIAVAVFLAGLLTHHAGQAGSSLGPEGVAIDAGPPLASPDTMAGGQSVDSIGCLNGEQVAYHVHIHLAVFVNGHPRQVPAGVGIVPPRRVQTTPVGAFVTSGACFYWLHTHAADGIIHIESPSVKVYTLGNFFDIWRQPLDSNRVGPARGPVTVFLNGHRDNVDPRSIPLTAHQVIQLDVGTPLVKPHAIAFPPGL